MMFKLSGKLALTMLRLFDSALAPVAFNARCRFKCDGIDLAGESRNLSIA